ncbi:MAG: DUF4157 domain-containing protein [Ilumatobacteraceae bacterium]
MSTAAVRTADVDVDVDGGASRIRRSAVRSIGAATMARRPAVSAEAHRCGPGCVRRHAAPGAHDHDHEHEHEHEHERSAVSAATGSRIVRSLLASSSATAHRCGPACVQRHVGHHHEAEVGAAGGDLGTELTGRIQRAAGGGAMLAEPIRRSMETAFGSDFSSVRIHADSAVAPRIGASAFTSGSDIHFAPGQYQPTTRSGQWLLGHELTHVVQQTGGAPAASDVHRHVGGGCIQRHASKEHYMLGSMTPDQIKAIADAKGKVDSAVAASSGFMNLFNSLKFPSQAALAEGLTSVREQLVGLNNWRSSTVDSPDPAAVPKGETAYDHHWGGQLVTVPCRDGEIVCTVGELNAIPDFFGSFEDMAKVDRSIVFKTLQVIRRESYMYLKSLEAQLQNKEYKYDSKQEGFGGLDDNNISISNAFLPKAGDDVADLLATESMLKGKDGETGLDDATGATATLGRNACHFPPESWLRWREHHTKARNLIDGATSAAALGGLANSAIGLNAFGEHYLQDSFAAGHLINKGFVMAVAMEHMGAGTKKIRGVTDAHIRELQTATAHADAYDLPDDAMAKVNAQNTGADEPVNSLDVPTLKARDPQSALDSARALGSTGASKGDGRREEMRASGISPDSMTFSQYRLWLNDFWLQKITNTLHDKYCVNGLKVASPDNAEIFKIYGDNNMMRSSEGATYTAATSLMSRGAINAMVENKREALAAAESGVQAPPPRPVTSIEEIIARFPNRVVDDDGTEMSLATWATGAPMRKKIAALVNARTGDFVTGAVRAMSTVKQVSKGLDASHGPF